ncbi:hypothetical protein EJ05DRAFT_36500 [Pseudovirgaria hyperparasitica]|uniref:C2H2-type domain-containing protein n=1 Tax=Pseudovirgaria hyperparasitica TaxID=470096 RepID=A0A6A6WML0_9PEZI|nr:uncharacterized protein EJ05DRAFT_36500 [Pseudovirgaria hyperparasitica]KAF2763366.1 hypothetical protein EJ05DRAFT_36500 [Pseudovirgaria hyperparasitica]
MRPSCRRWTLPISTRSASTNVFRRLSSGCRTKQRTSMYYMLLPRVITPQDVVHSAFQLTEPIGSTTYTDVCHAVEKLHMLIDRCNEDQYLTQRSIYIHAQHICFYVSCLNDVLAIVRKQSVFNNFIHRGRIEDLYLETHDFTRTREIFPNADTPLVCRLSNGISRRRRRLKERILAPSLSVPKVKREYGEGSRSSPPMTLHEPEIPLKPYGLEILLEEPFDCATCFRKVTTETQRDYIHHIDHDLKPYLCTYVDCITPLRMYGSQAEWFEHEKTCRRQSWECQSIREPALKFNGCTDESDEPFSFSSETEFQVHVLQQHPEEWDQIEQITAQCKIDDRKLRMSPDCRLCGFRAGNLERLEPHLGAHMRELALLSLPESLR